MLPNGLQMLPLLWLLLCMSKMGLSSSLSPGDVTAVSVPEDMPIQCNRSLDQVPPEITDENLETEHDLLGYKTTRVRMVDSNNGELDELGMMKFKAEESGQWKGLPCGAGI